MYNYNNNNNNRVLAINFILMFYCATSVTRDGNRARPV